MEMSTRPIAALSTPHGRGALAVIRLTGDGSQSVFAAIIRGRGRFEKEIARKIGLYTIVSDCNCGGYNSAKTIDEVTAIKYDAPHSFTGEEMVEIFCHGGTAVTGKILDQLFRHGARPAGRGEFSRRALINGKIGLLKAESIAALIDCHSEARLQSAQLAYQGKQLESLERLKCAVISILSDIESRIEFGNDDDVAESLLKSVSANKRGLGEIIEELEEELRRSDRIRAFDDGVTIALAGPANAGKSSLFNEILGYDRSIVHDRPGTTRDVVSERIIFEGVAVKLFDSAGIRETEDVVERDGITRTMSALRGARFVLWVTSADQPLEDAECKSILEVINNVDNTDTKTGAATNCSYDKIIVVINKIDIASSISKREFCEKHSLKYIETSLTKKTNVDNLFDIISAVIHSVTDDIYTPEIIINERHRAIAELIIGDLRSCVDNFDREEISAYYLKGALGRLEEFCGHTAGDEVLDEIFGKFCIGK